MINFDYRFPLFDNILFGSLNPFLTDNSHEAFLGEQNLKIELNSIADKGRLGFRFHKPTNFKCSFYYHKLAQETFLYCNDTLQYLEVLQDADMRAYARLTLLDKHLKTCLIRLGEIIQANNLYAKHFLHPTHDTNPDLLSNSYIFHLLKVCVAKAYLEIQLALSDVIHNPLTEAMLYTAMVGELPPVKCYMKQLDVEKLQNPSNTKVTTLKQEKELEQPSSLLSETVQVTPTTDPQKYTVKQLVVMKVGSDRTIRRMLEKKELIGIKQKNGWRIENVELQRYWNNLKTQQNNKSKP